jgi:hypothetical protein
MEDPMTNEERFKKLEELLSLPIDVFDSHCQDATIPEQRNPGHVVFTAPKSQKYQISAQAVGPTKKKITVKVYDPSTGLYKDQEMEVDYSQKITPRHSDFPYWQTPTADEVCSHTWKNYVGFTETYEYCTKCDMKREGKK